MNILTWQLKNAPHRFSYAQARLSDEDSERLAAMRRDGFFVGKFEGDELPQFQAEAASILAGDAVYQHHIQNKIPVGEKKAKEWIYSFLPRSDGPAMRFVRSGKIRSLAGAYLGMEPVLTELHYSVSFDGDKDIGSNFWHRDRGDYRFFRIFIYLDEITKSTGGHVGFVPGSQRGGKLARAFPNWGARGVRIKDGMNLPHEDIYGPAGTLVFCDTGGIHRNGRAHQPVRKMLIVFATHAHARQAEVRELGKIV